MNMERLTYYDCAGAACFDYESPVMNGVMANKAISRLAKYEDTGLTPERVAELAQAEREKGCEYCGQVSKSIDNGEDGNSRAQGLDYWTKQPAETEGKK